MPSSSVPTAQLRALSTEARRRKILAAYRRMGTLEKTAHALGCPTRALSRMIADDPRLDADLKRERERNAVTP